MWKLFILASLYLNSGVKKQASYYSDSFNGKITASGEIFDNSLPTAAHLTLPFGSVLLVTNKANNKSTLVRINDRGAYEYKGRRYVPHPTRILDLSKSAFSEIADTCVGIIDIKYEVIWEQ